MSSFLTMAKPGKEGLEHDTEEARVFTLSNSHTLSYNVYGSAISSSPTILYFHGQPGSRKEGSLWAATANRLDVRVIAVDRPGSGLSSFQPKRTILDWPPQVSELMAHLQISKFSILGSSGGAPYALACAKLLPPAQIRHIGIVGGLGPRSLGVEGMGWSNRIGFLVAYWMPWIIKPFVQRFFVSVAKDPDPQALENALLKSVSSMPEPDRECYETKTVRHGLANSFRESVRNGADGVAHEMFLTSRPWGFDIEDIQLEGIKLWYGTADIMCPVSIGRQISKRLKHADLSEYEGEGHVSVPYKYNEVIIKALV